MCYDQADYCKRSGGRVMSVARHGDPRLDFDEYVIALCDALLDFVDDPRDREEVRRISQRIIVTRGGA